MVLFMVDFMVGSRVAWELPGSERTLARRGSCLSLVQVCPSLPKSAHVYPSLPKSAQVCSNLLKFAPPAGASTGTGSSSSSQEQASSSTRQQSSEGSWYVVPMAPDQQPRGRGYAPQGNAGCGPAARQQNHWTAYPQKSKVTGGHYGRKQSR